MLTGQCYRQQRTNHLVSTAPPRFQPLADLFNEEIYGRHGVKPHYRRGFVRFNQRFGKGLLQTRPVLIPPVLVNAHKLAGEAPGKTQM